MNDTGRWRGSDVGSVCAHPLELCRLPVGVVWSAEAITIPDDAGWINLACEVANPTVNAALRPLDRWPTGYRPVDPGGAHVHYSALLGCVNRHTQTTNPRPLAQCLNCKSRSIQPEPLCFSSSNLRMNKSMSICVTLAAVQSRSHQSHIITPFVHCGWPGFIALTPAK